MFIIWNYTRAEIVSGEVITGFFYFIFVNNFNEEIKITAVVTQILLCLKLFSSGGRGVNQKIKLI